MPLKLVISKKAVTDFRHGDNIHCDREIFHPLKLGHCFTDNISNQNVENYGVAFVTGANK